MRFADDGRARGIGRQNPFPLGRFDGAGGDVEAKDTGIREVGRTLGHCHSAER
jgi:hypothetical protein